jgi:uncharacterized damage-inducible protein DinB
MSVALDREFLDYSATKLRQLGSRIEACLQKLDDTQVWARGGERENAIGNLVLHLSGNVRQWIIAGVGGAPDRRDRDAEFAARGGCSKPELVSSLRATVDEACAALARVSAERLGEHIVVQHYDVSVMEAIYHVVEHFAGHTGQIVFATKALTSEDLGFHRHLRTTAAHSEKTP